MNGYVKRFITVAAGPTQVWLRLFPLKAHSSLPLAPWKRETWHKKVLLALPMKSSFLSRDTTLQLPNTQMMLYPPQQPSASEDGCKCLSPHQHAILRGRACARWLISTEHTLLPFLLLSLVLFSSSSCLLRVHFIYSFLDGAPGFFLQPCPYVLYTIQAAHPESCRALLR